LIKIIASDIHERKKIKEIIVLRDFFSLSPLLQNANEFGSTEPQREEQQQQLK
jgi:hypothetical protein